METTKQPAGYLFNELLCVIATEYAERFAYSLKVDRLWDRELENHPVAVVRNEPLRQMRFEGVADPSDGVFPPFIQTRQRFGNLMLDIYYPKEENRGVLAFVAVEFRPNGEFVEAQVFHTPGVNLLSELLMEIQGRWEALKAQHGTIK